MVVTEYNVMERAGPFKLSWAHAMFVGSCVLNLLSVRQMDTAMLHVLLDGYGWRPLSHEWDYEKTSERIQVEVFADEYRQMEKLLGGDNG